MSKLSVVAEFTATIQLGEPQLIGATPDGVRRMVPIVAGSFAGTSLRGLVLPGGADWQYQRPDGATMVSAIYLLQTDDGIVIQIDNQGIRRGPPEVLRRLANGEAVDPDEYYFRTRPVFHAPAGRYDWLNSSLFVATAARHAARVELEVFRVL